MARTNDITIDFISCTEFVQKIPCEISMISPTVDTVVPANINFFGASVEGNFEADAMMWYQVN